MSSSRILLCLCLLGLLAVVVDGFWVGPLWGYQKGQGQDGGAQESVGDEVENKYPAWLAPADLDRESHFLPAIFL